MKLTREKYFYVMALWILARKKQREVDKLDLEANTLIGKEVGSELSDSIYNTYATIDDEETFGEMMSEMGIKMKKK